MEGKVSLPGIAAPSLDDVSGVLKSLEERDPSTLAESALSAISSPQTNLLSLATSARPQDVVQTHLASFTEAKIESISSKIPSPVRQLSGIISGVTGINLPSSPSSNTSLGEAEGPSASSTKLSPENLISLASATAANPQDFVKSQLTSFAEGKVASISSKLPTPVRHLSGLLSDVIPTVNAAEISTSSLNPSALIDSNLTSLATSSLPTLPIPVRQLSGILEESADLKENGSKSKLLDASNVNLNAVLSERTPLLAATSTPIGVGGVQVSPLELFTNPRGTLENLKSSIQTRLFEVAKSKLGIGNEDDGVGEESDDDHVVIIIWQEVKVVLGKGVLESSTTLLSTLPTLLPTLSLGHLSLSSLGATTLGNLIVNLVGTTMLEGVSGVLKEVLPVDGAGGKDERESEAEEEGTSEIEQPERAQSQERERQVAEWTWRVGVAIIASTVPLSILYNTLPSLFLFLNPSLDSEVVELSGSFLSWYSFGLPAYALTLILPTYLSSHNLTSVTSRILALTSSLSVFLSWLFVHSPNSVSFDFSHPFHVPFPIPGLGKITIDVPALLMKINRVLAWVGTKVEIDPEKLDFGTYENPFNLGFIGAPLATVLSYYAVAFLSVGYILLKMDIRKWPRPVIPGSGNLMKVVENSVKVVEGGMVGVKNLGRGEMGRAGSESTLVSAENKLERTFSSTSTIVSPTPPPLSPSFSSVSFSKGKGKDISCEESETITNPNPLERTLSSSSTLVPTPPLSPSLSTFSSFKGKGRDISSSSHFSETTFGGNIQGDGSIVGGIGSVIGEVGSLAGGFAGAVGGMGLDTAREVKEEIEKYIFLLRRGVSNVAQSAILTWPGNIPTFAVTVLGPVAMGAQSILIASAGLLLSTGTKGIEEVITSRLRSFVEKKKPRRAKIVSWIALTATFGVSWMVMGVVLGMGKKWGDAWTSDEGAAFLVTNLLPLLCFVNILDSLVRVTSLILKLSPSESTNRLGKLVTLVNTSVFPTLSLPLGLFLAFHPDFRYGLRGLWMGNLAGLGVQALVGTGAVGMIQWEAQGEERRDEEVIEP